MPKKTKREKIIAEYRRRLQSVRETAPTNPEYINESLSLRPTTSSSHYIYQTKTNTSRDTVAASQPMDRRVRRDLVKTLMLATVAIGGEVVLSTIINK